MVYSWPLDHVELPHVLYHGVLLVNFVNWMGKWDHSKIFLLEHSFMVKIKGWCCCGWLVAHVIIVSAPVPIGPFDLRLLWVWDLDWV